MMVNPHETAIQSELSYKSIAELPLVPDLAVVATPAHTVPSVINDLADRGCRAAIVISAGLGQKATVQQLQDEMLQAAKPKLMRIVGPNSLGVISTVKGINASFAHLMPRRGDMALVSQSGAIVTAMLDWADTRKIGFSHVISLGNMADIDFGDVLDFLSSDPKTRSILLYVENVTHAKKFMSAARIAARLKPIVVVKAGRSPAGAKAALSHTGALAGADAVYDAAFRRAGILRVAGLEELFEAAASLAMGIHVKGDRLAILTNGGGAGVLAVDALIKQRGHLALLNQKTIAELNQVIPNDGSVSNPIDLRGDATGERYADALEILLGIDEADAILVINCPTAVTPPAVAARAVARVTSERHGLPILASWIGGTAAASGRELLTASKILSLDSPDDAIRAFMHIVQYHRNQELLLATPAAGVTVTKTDVEGARLLIEGVLAEGRSVLMETETKTLLSHFGIPTVKALVARNPEEAGMLSTALGYPVALKILSPDITHKSDAGGVILNLTSRGDVESAAKKMLEHIAAARPLDRILGFVVEEMITRTDAQELITGLTMDATFGPVILFGHGGKATEVIDDHAVGLPPLNSVLARDMIDRTQISKLFAGYRNVPPIAVDAISDVLVRLSELAIHLPQIVELDLNPLLADATGVVALDARAVIRRKDGNSVELAIRPYPTSLERDVEMRNGTRFLLRPIKPDDEEALTAMVALCTQEDLRLRFFGQLKSFPHQMAARFSQIDYDREMALVAVNPATQHRESVIYGVVRLVADPENDQAEFAVIVRSDMKGHGLGYQLMTEILAYAKSRGLREVHGDILRGNVTMLQMAHELGFITEKGACGDVSRVSIRLSHKETAGPTELPSEMPERDP